MQTGQLTSLSQSGSSAVLAISTVRGGQNAIRNVLSFIVGLSVDAGLEGADLLIGNGVRSEDGPALFDDQGLTAPHALESDRIDAGDFCGERDRRVVVVHG